LRNVNFISQMRRERARLRLDKMGKAMYAQVQAAISLASTMPKHEQPWGEVLRIIGGGGDTVGVAGIGLSTFVTLICVM